MSYLKVILAPIVALMLTYGGIGVRTIQTSDQAVRVPAPPGHIDAVWQSPDEYPLVIYDQPGTSASYAQGEIKAIVRATSGRTQFSVLVGDNDLILYYDRGSVIYRGHYRTLDEALTYMTIWLNDITDAE